KGPPGIPPRRAPSRGRSHERDTLRYRPAAHGPPPRRRRTHRGEGTGYSSYPCPPLSSPSEGFNWSGSGAMAERLAKKVLIVGWDAADWQMIDPLLKGGQMPVLAAFLRGGVRAAIQTLHPIISPILWNSIATGKRADKHDILGFLEPDGKGGVRPVSSTSRRAKAVW